MGRVRELPIALALAVGLTTLTFLAFTSTGRDDPFFTYWMAESIRSGSVAGYNGTPFEQTSSLLHALILALLSSITGSTVLISAKLVEAAVSIALLSLCFLRLRVHRSRWASLLGTTALAGFPLFAYWSWGGLETSAVVLFGLLQAAVLAQVLRDPGRGTALRLLALNLAYVFLRPEAILVLPAQAVILAGVLGWRRWRGAFPLPPRACLAAIAVPLGAALLAGPLVRLALFGRPLPSTVIAKSLWHSGMIQRLGKGLAYGLAPPGFGWIGGVFVVAVLLAACAVVLRSRSRFAATLFSLALAQGLATVSGGGDWMEMGRFLVSPLFLLLFCILDGASGRFWRACVGLLAALSALLYGLTAFSASAFRRLAMTQRGYFPLFRPVPMDARLTLHPGGAGAEIALDVGDATLFRCQRPFEVLKVPHYRDCLFLEGVYRATEQKRLFQFRPGDTVLSYQAGMVPYYLLRRHPRLRFIDPVGLGSPERTTDPSLAFRGDVTGPPVMAAFLKRFRPTFVFDLDTHRDQLVAAGYVPVVSLRLRAPLFPYAEVFYVRSDRLSPGASAAD